MAAEAEARRLDEADPLSVYRQRFLVPRGEDGEERAYLCGHSLGLQPKAARGFIERELAQWAEHGVEGHFEGEAPWYSYHELFRETGARLVGAQPGETVFMNSLTANLHLMLLTFYKPTPARHKILIDTPAFPSDLYALQSQLAHHGFDPETGLLRVGESDDILGLLREHGPQINVIVLNAVNFVTGRFQDVAALTAEVQRQGCVAGWDLAHAAGNVPLRLHEWNVDFAVWCSYKYLNGGPGAVGGCFVHERHGRNRALPRLAGWWGNDPATRFRMASEDGFAPQPGAAGWQLSNPPILALAPLRASLALFDEVGLDALRQRSLRLTAYLERLLDERQDGSWEMLTPRRPEARGCQLSLRFKEGARQRVERLRARGVVADFREPDVIRLAPVPLYNSFHDIWRAATALRQC